MMSSGTARRAGATVLVGVILAGCGAFAIPKVPSFKAPSFKAPSFKPTKGSGDTADFFFDPERVTIIQSGRIQVDFGVPALRYRGPLGCRGRTFEGDVTDNIKFVFRYGSRDASLGWDNSNVWHF